MPLFAIDSNILIYAEGVSDGIRRDIAISVIHDIGPKRILLPAQASGETAKWLMGKGGFSRAEAVRRVTAWMDQCVPIPVTTAAFRQALGLVQSHAFQLWDAVICAASAEARADILLSENMQHGFRQNLVESLDS